MEPSASRQENLHPPPQSQTQSQQKQKQPQQHHQQQQPRESFWRRQVARLPGSIVPNFATGPAGSSKRMVYGAQHTFMTPSSLVGKNGAASIGTISSNSSSSSRAVGSAPDASHSARANSSAIKGENYGAPNASASKMAPGSAWTNRSHSATSAPENFSLDELVFHTNDAWSDIDEGDPIDYNPLPSADPASSFSPAEAQQDTQSVSKKVSESLVTSNPSRAAASSLSINADVESTLSTGSSSGASRAVAPQTAASSYSTTLSTRIARFQALLSSEIIDLGELRKTAWSGIPFDMRPLVWKLLLGYVPCARDRRETVLANKRKDYSEYVTQLFGLDAPERQRALYHQIHIDVLRTLPVPFYKLKRVQDSLEHILYCWALRHPASGYVQGINDLATPFFTVFLCEHIDKAPNPMLETWPSDSAIEQISDDVFNKIEADTYWCLTKLIDGIQDNYTHAQPGIQRQVVKLQELISRIDQQLFRHLADENIEFLHFAFRWMNCLLMREVVPSITIRMWDTYLSEGGDFMDFHVYVCAAFLLMWSKDLRTKQFGDILLFLQNPPTQGWKEKDVEPLLSKAFMYKSLYHDAPNHYHLEKSKEKSVGSTQ